MSGKPRLAITMGDAAGVGPEIALRVWQDLRVQTAGIPLLFGDAKLFTRVAEKLGCDVPSTLSIDDLSRTALDTSGHLIDCGPIDAEAVVAGTFSKTTGIASYETICAAIDATIRGEVDAIVTGPIQKEAWSLGGIAYPGHTELLADRVASQSGGQPAAVRMMLASETIACVLETIHVPLADVPGLLTTASLTRTIELAGETMRRRRARRGSLLPPRIGVCGLNPHAGENGLFSHGEEELVVVPAIESARKKGWEVLGPLPPDTAFTPMMRSKIDIYVCLYHDQGLIPLKALSFDDAVNVTLGLPIIRTSVDHGTAMDLAWQGKACCLSMIAAIELASELVETR